MVNLAMPAVHEVGVQGVDNLGNLRPEPEPNAAIISGTKTTASIRIHRKGHVQLRLRRLREGTYELAGRSNV